MGERKRKHLCRVAVGSNRKGWLVRVSRSPVIHQKLFTDLAHGGCRGAELAARKWRDQILREVGPPQPRRERFPEVAPRSTKTTPGICGVTRQRKHHHWVRNGEKHKEWGWYYIASWTEEGRHREKAWSVNKYGEEVARRLAEEFRMVFVARKTRNIAQAVTSHARHWRKQCQST